MEKNNIFGAFGYSQSHMISEEVLGLFTDLYHQSLNGHVKEVKYAYDIVNAGMDGRINFNKPFNLQAYEYKIENNQKLSKYHKRKKESYLDESNNEEAGQNGGIQENKILKLSNSFDESEIDGLFEQSEVMTAINVLQAVQDDFLKSEGINLSFLLKRAMQGVPIAVEKLKSLCEEFELLGEQIKIVLSSKEGVACTLV